MLLQDTEEEERKTELRNDVGLFKRLSGGGAWLGVVGELLLGMTRTLQLPGKMLSDGSSMQKPKGISGLGSKVREGVCDS